jgi:2-polyprenyl-3-methyl-5-hydroxy-6-metoxy-1,4-benzoquinol methylase
MNNADKIVASWFANADNWIGVIDNAEIESRKICTNQAIVDTVLSYPLNTILDIGCGEGWLTRILRRYGKQSYGVDVVPALIENAIEKDGNYYQVCSYATLIHGTKLMLNFFNAAVFNFCLLDKDESENLLKALHQYISKDGVVFIQTLHPSAIADINVSAWKEGNWNGFNKNFTKPYDWYFRTLADWQILFVTARLKLIEIIEPHHPGTKKPLSVIFVLQNINSR